MIFSIGFTVLTKEEIIDNIDKFEQQKQRIPQEKLLTLLDLSKPVSKGFLLDMH